MTSKRLPGESFANYKDRRKAEQLAVKNALKSTFKKKKITIDGKTVEVEIKHASNRRSRRGKEPRETNNSKGVQMLVRQIGTLNFYRARKHVQLITDGPFKRRPRRIIHFVDCHASV